MVSGAWSIHYQQGKRRAIDHCNEKGKKNSSTPKPFATTPSILPVSWNSAPLKDYKKEDVFALE